MEVFNKFVLVQNAVYDHKTEQYKLAEVKYALNFNDVSTIVQEKLELDGKKVFIITLKKGQQVLAACEKLEESGLFKTEEAVEQ